MSRKANDLNWEMIVYRRPAPERTRRRLWFTAHTGIYLLFALLQSAFLPLDPAAVALRSVLLMMLLLHLYTLYAVDLLRPSVRALVPAEARSVCRPMPSDPAESGVQSRFHEDDFWYRWHDV